MSARLPTRRDVLATSAAAAAIGLLPRQFAAAADDNTIRPFFSAELRAAFRSLRKSI